MTSSTEPRCRPLNHAAHFPTPSRPTFRFQTLSDDSLSVIRSPTVPRTSIALFFGVCLAITASAQTKTVKPVWPDEGPFKWAPRPTSPAITANDLRTRLYQFADDSMMGRRIG